MTKNHYMLIGLILLGVIVCVAYYFGYKTNPSYMKDDSLKNTLDTSAVSVTESNPTVSTPSNSTPIASSTTVLDSSTPISETGPSINKCELKQGWYYGSLNQKKPGTPSDWTHEGEGLRSAQWRAQHEPRVLTAEEEAECDKMN